jgi:hypothetical protein
VSAGLTVRVMNTEDGFSKAGRRYTFAFRSLSLRFIFLLYILQSVCWLSCSIVNAFFYVPGKLNEMKEPLSPLRKAVAASGSSGSATGKILLCYDCSFSICYIRFPLRSVSGQVIYFG